MQACGAAGVLGIVVSMALGALECSKPSRDAHESPPSSETPVVTTVPGQMRVTAGEHGFTPSSLALPHGPPGSKTTVTFLRTTDKTCATEIVFPELDVKKDLPLEVPVPIDVPTDSARTLTFQCGMAMYKGALVVK